LWVARIMDEIEVRIRRLLGKQPDGGARPRR
jgi:hypothetical protein